MCVMFEFACNCASINNQYFGSCCGYNLSLCVDRSVCLSHCLPLSFSLRFVGLWGLFEWLILMKSNESFEYTSKLFMLCWSSQERLMVL